MPTKMMPLNLDISNLVEIDLNSQEPEVKDALIDFAAKNPRDRLIQRDGEDTVKVWLTAPKLQGLMIKGRIRF